MYIFRTCSIVTGAAASCNRFLTEKTMKVCYTERWKEREMYPTLRITYGVSALILLCSFASIAEPDASEKRTILELGDLDGDGTLSLLELRGVVPNATAALFKRLDTDNDGRLSTKDWNWNSSRGRVIDNFPSLFMADANHDRRVTFEEASSYFTQMTPPEFIRLDADSDGAITREEYSSTLRRPPDDAIRRLIDELMRADSDGDEKANWEEVRKQAPDYPRPVFDWLDQNSDGTISESDYRKPIPLRL